MYVVGKENMWKTEQNMLDSEEIQELLTTVISIGSVPYHGGGRRK